jgi:hypothetical protein
VNLNVETFHVTTKVLDNAYFKPSEAEALISTPNYVKWRYVPSGYKPGAT